MWFGKKTSMGKALDPSTMNEREKIDYYMQSIEAALEARKDEERLWDEGARIFNAEDGERLVPSNMQQVHTHYGHFAMNKVLNRINFRAPGVEVLSRSMDESDKDTSALVRGWWDYYCYTRDIKEDVIDPLAIDAISATIGILQVGWKGAQKPSSEEKAKEQLRKAADAIAAGGDIYEEIASEPDISFPPDDGHDDHADGEPYMQHIDVWDFLCCPGFTTLKQAWRNNGWVAKRIIVPLSVAQGNRDYKNRDKIQASWAFESSSMRNDESINASTGAGKRESLVEYAILWEVWVAPDKARDRKSMVYVISEGCDKFHYKAENPYEFLDAFPFVEIPLKPRKRGASIYGTWYLKPFYDTLNEIDVLRSVKLDRAKCKRNVLLGQSNMLSDKEAAAITQAPEGTVHLVRHPDSLSNIELTAQAPELETETAQSVQDFFMKSGVGPNQMGGFSIPGASATEASLVQQNLNSDTDEMARRLGKGWIRAARMVVKLLKRFADPTQMLIASREDGRNWKEFTIQDIAGEFDIRLGVGTQEPVDEAVRRKQMMDAITVVSSFAPGSIREDLIIPDFLELEGFPNARNYVRDDALWDQKDEFMAMLMGNPHPVQPNDRHFQHLRDGSKILSMLQQGVQMNQQNGVQTNESTLMAMQMLQQHLATHQQFVSQQSGGQVGSLPAMKMDAPMAAAGGGI